MRLVVRILESKPLQEQAAPTVWVNLDEFPLELPEKATLYPLRPPPEGTLEAFAEESGQPAVQELGGRLLEALQVHPAVDAAFTNALASREPCPIYLRLDSGSAAEYPWESLFSPASERFLALESRWPIARVTEFAPADKDVRYFAPPLRMLAVLSAIGVDAAHEWRQLHEHVAAVRSEHGFDLRLRVVAGQPHVKEAVDGLQDAAFSASMLQDRESLFDEIARFDPHVLHFFCHGSGAPSPHLELATPSDHLGADGTSSLFVEPDQLSALGLANWLVVLNCCRGGTSDSGVKSLAHQLISAGYPAAVGMREPIDFRDANRFTGGFYRSLLGRLAEDLQPRREVAIEWAASLRVPREALLERYRQPTTVAAAHHRNWTLPVLYVRPEPLRVRTVEVHPDHNQATRDYLLAQCNLFSKARLTLDARTAQPAIDEIGEKIDALLARLRAPPDNGS